MADISQALIQMGQMAIIVVLGFIAVKAKAIRADLSQDLANLILNITVPCMVLGSVSSVDESAGAEIIIAGAVMAIALFSSLFVSGVISNLILRPPKEERPTYLFMSICTNVGFIGLALVASFYGMQSVIIVSVLLAVNGVLLYSIGFGVLASGVEGGGRGIPWKSMANPANICSIIAIIMVLGHLRWPPVISTTLSTVGGATVPLAMLMVGILVANSSLKDILTEWRLYPFILIRQGACSVAVIFVLKLLGVDTLYAGIFTVLFAMPVAALAPALVQYAGGEPTLAMKGTVLSTIASFAIIPPLILVMGMVWA